MVSEVRVGADESGARTPTPAGAAPREGAAPQPGAAAPRPGAAAPQPNPATDVRVSAPTEERHPDTGAIDQASSLDILSFINAADRDVAPAVGAVLPDLADLVDDAVANIRQGGSVHYFGAGTSGRLAVLDAAELLPTFNAPEGLFVAHHAGGPDALLRAVENVEDDPEQGAREADTLTPLDIAIGLTASGRTPFVRGALARASERGARTALVTANPHAELAAYADIVLAPPTGPEVITGSTRLKAGTAQKLILNAFSTAVMVRLGHTWSNLMVDVVATNSKLRGRVVRILEDAAGVSEDVARAALDSAGGELKPALVALLADKPVSVATAALAHNQHSVAAAVRALTPPDGLPSARAPHHQSTTTGKIT